jgi:hypothetical protein
MTHPFHTRSGVTGGSYHVPGPGAVARKPALVGISAEDIGFTINLYENDYNPQDRA